MKIRNVRGSAFVTLRALVASLLCLAAMMLALLAGAGSRQPGNNKTASFPWLSRVASALGFQPSAQGTGGAAIKVDKYPAERPKVTAQPAPAIPYSGPPRDLRPVNAVRTGKLLYMPPINPDRVEKHYHPEPRLPAPPTKSGGPEGPVQTQVGSLASAPAPAGLNFDGVGVGLAGFNPSSNPPDVNGRAGATQYVQWNNTSLAVFNKTTGALEYGPAAGNTLFQALGGVCASHNNGDPVVSYDILAGRWVMSQFVVGGPAGGYSHQCFAVSATSDATGEYYLYDFTTDPVNFVDYPHHGVWPDGYYMAAHIFSAVPVEAPPPPVGANVFITGRGYVFEREKMLDGLPARMQSIDFGPRSGMLPADLDSLTPPPVGEAAFFLGPNEALTNITNSYRVKVTWDPVMSITMTRSEILGGIGNAACVNTAVSRACVPQPPPAVPADYLDNLSGRYMYRLAYRNQGTQAAPDESLVVSATSTGSTSTPAHGAVEWFEFRHDGNSLTHPTLFQNATYDPDTNYRWMPSAAMDKDRNILVGYSKSSTTVKPGIYLTGRLASDPINTTGAEVQMKAGEGVQIGSTAGNRWGDYTAMTLDPIDQCTFYYTNEYLKTNGAFNWSTRIASFKFPSCVSAANLYGTVTGRITSAETGAPIAGVRVALSNDFAGASDENGIYKILVPAGTYSASAADADRNCTSASPAAATVSPPGGGTVTQNFTMTGTSKLEANGFEIDDSLGTKNGIVNRGECVRLNLGIKNNGCALEKAISGKLTTTTPGVTVVQSDSSYTDKAIDQSGNNVTPYKISVSNSFGCGSDITLSLALTYASGTKTIQYIIPTCGGGPDQGFGPYTLTTSDATQDDRLGRNGFPSTCSGKPAPADIGTAGTRRYKTFGPFNNAASVPRCYSVTINAALNGPGDIQSAAYNATTGGYDPTNLQANYLGDTGISGLGTTVSQATYSFTVPAGHSFVVVVNTTSDVTNGTIASSQFSGTVSGFINNNPGPGDCATIPPVPELTAVASRKVHGTAGAFNIPLPLNGTGIECRSGGATDAYQLIYTFNAPVSSCGTASKGTAAKGPATNQCTVNLTAANAQYHQVTLNGVVRQGGGADNIRGPEFGVLVGDVNQTGLVDGNDVSAVQMKTRQRANETTFKTDVNTTGLVDGNDVSEVQSRTRSRLPRR